MAISPLPAPLQQLGGRRFSFYPPIRNVDHNEWIYRRATWTEVVVVNAQSGVEACIPRSFVGDVSFVDDPTVIVGLRRELQWLGNGVRAWRAPVIEFPVAMDEGAAPVPHPDHPAAVVSIRLDHPESRTSLKLGVGLVLTAVGCLIAADIARSWIRTGAVDDYSSIVRKIGSPDSEHLVHTADGHVYRMLRYPKRGSVIVLSVGADADARSAHYIGALDLNGRVLNAVTLRGGVSAVPLLRSLPPF
jgi:hypothetical protein